MASAKPVPPQLRGSFEELRRRLGMPRPLQAASPLPVDPETLRFALALRGRCDPSTIFPTDVVEPGVLDAVAADCETGSARDRRWLLLEPVRRRVIRSRPPNVVANAIREVPDHFRDEVTEALGYLYIAPPADLDALSATALRALIAASAWTVDHAPVHHDVSDLRRLLRKNTREDEYRRIVSRGVFGREREIERIREFMGASVSQTGQPGEPRILHVFGPGGIGKSTLIAATALTVLADPAAALVHLDFDRTDLDPTRPSTLELELLRQAGLGNIETERHVDGHRERIHAQLSDDLVSGEFVQRQQVVLESIAGSSRSALAGAVEFLQSPPRPLLLIVDTLEQIEAGGPQYVGALLVWLRELAYLSGAPELRVLVSGRSHPKETSFPDAADDELLPIGELDERGAIELLTANHVPDGVAAQVFQTFGGNPLVLRLAGDLISQLEPDAMTEIVREAQAGQLPVEMVQGLLYDRFLKHIKSPGDKYAHPGLVLPEITPELIQHVLARVLRVPMTASEASEVFEALASAHWLVTLTGSALTQRRDLRQLMLKLMRSDPSRAALVDKVHDEAIAFHAEFPTLDHLAFGVYHRLMKVTEADDLDRFESIDFPALQVWLRPHLDDLPALSRAYAQGRLLRGLGAEEALRTLPDQSWTRYLAGDGTIPGEGDRLVHGSDPMIALDLWRRRPVRIDGHLPLFVLEALADAGEWDDPALEGTLDALDGLSDDDASADRLYWLTRLELLRLRPLSELHKQSLARSSGQRPEQVAVTAVAEAFTGEPLIPNSVLFNALWASETRLYLVHATRFGHRESFRPQLDALVVLQDDWAARIKAAFPYRRGPVGYFQRLAADIRSTRARSNSAHLPSWINTPLTFAEVRGDRKIDVDRPPRADVAQVKISALNGSPLDRVTTIFGELRETVCVQLAGRSAPALVLALRGPTPELHRPVRQALREALRTAAQIASFITRLRPAFSLCPVDFEPPEFTARAGRDPAAWFLALVQFADRARLMETLLDAALAEAPDHAKLRRVRDTWVAWDRAIGSGNSSEWNPRDPRSAAR